MKFQRKLPLLTALAVLGLTPVAPAQQNAMTFFVTSVGPGNGGDLGGIEGADRYCQSMAAAAGAGSRTWHAYLSTAGGSAINARDRIGAGPWQNAKGVVIAKTVDELHGDGANLTKETILNEKGEMNKGRGDTPNQHDIMTGSQADGRAFPANISMTCGDWKSSSVGVTEVGHSDRQGLSDTPIARSWNSSHTTRACGQADLVATGGAGLIYCFATN